MKIASSPPPCGPRVRCTPPVLGDGHAHPDSVHLSHKQGPLGPSKVGLSEVLRGEVVSLTQELVRINSGPDNLVAGENQVVDRMQAYADEAGLLTQRFETRNGKPMLIVTLPGQNPQAGSVGFVHHSDVVQPEGNWKLGQPFSGNLTDDEAGRLSIVGRGTIDTKGPAAQILVAMKHLKQQGAPLEATMKLFVFPDEEFGGKDGAWLLSRKNPELFTDVKQWVVEGSGIFSPEFLSGLAGQREVPYLAVAQKYTIPMQLQLKQATDCNQAVEKTQGALQRLDSYIEDRDWTYLGDKGETKEAMRRMGDAVGGLKGFLIRHFYDWKFMRNRMGKGNAAANRTDFCKTDFYLNTNSAGKTIGPNVKPSSATAVLRLDSADRPEALRKLQQVAGQDLRVVDQEGLVQLSLPQENYHGGNHGSTADRQRDAVDVVNQALQRAQKKLGQELSVVDFYTSKSAHAPTANTQPVTTSVTLDLRVAVDEDPRAIIAQLGQVVGSDFELKPLFAPEEMDARVRRLRHDSPLFQAAEASLHKVYGDAPVLFGNTTASNDTRFLMEANPNSETLTFVPVLYTAHGAHGPDEAVTVRSLQQGVDWVVDLMENLGHQA